MLTLSIVMAILFGLFLSYANGANDNFKGVATLFGSGTANYRQALLWAAVTTFAGSVAAIFVANGLLEAFKGKGLVPAEVAANSRFGLSVALSAGITVMLASRFGFPISTTHSLIGGLIGAGLLASGAGIHADRLVNKFLVPLLISPFVAVTGAFLLYPLFRSIRRRLGIKRETCLCVGNEASAAAPFAAEGAAAAAVAEEVRTAIRVGAGEECREAYTGEVIGISAETILNWGHFLSAGAVSFARGLNDAPKIAALMLAGGAISPWFALCAVAAAMLAGGVLSVRKVAETMALKVTKMNQGQGFSANIVTSVLVIFASKIGVPVSTTHVSCGSLFGIGLVNKQGRWRMIAGILAAWLVTLPVAGAIGAMAYLLLGCLGDFHLTDPNH